MTTSGWRHRRIKPPSAAPLAFVVHADALLLLAAGFHHRPVGFNDRLIDEGFRLLTPDDKTRFMESFLQRENIELRKPSAEVSRSRGIRNALSPQRIEIRFVVASQFQMLQTRTARQQIERNVEHMIGFTVRQVKPEDRTLPVDASRDIQLPHKLPIPPAERACVRSASSSCTAGVTSMGECIGDCPFQLALSIRLATRRCRDFNRFRTLCFT